MDQLRRSTLILGQRRLAYLGALLRRFRENWAVFRRNRIAVLGLLILAFFGAMPILYPMLRSTVWRRPMYDPAVGFDQGSAPHPAPPSWIDPEALAPDNPHRLDQNRPSYDHLLGTDSLGRDVLSVLLASTLPTFVVGLSAALSTALFGVLIGACSAYYRGWVDGLFSHLSDAFLLLPAPIFMIGVGAFLRAQNTTLGELAYEALSGNSLGETAQIFTGALEFGLIYGVIAGLGGAVVVLRAHGLQVMNQSFIEAARVAGAGAGHIIFRHLVPHMAPLAAIYMMVAVTGAIVADGFLAFTGFNPTLLNWGTMVYYGFTYRVLNFIIPWNAIIAPAVAISLFAGAFYMISRGLHEVIEPRLRQ